MRRSRGSAGGVSSARRSMAYRNAASVLPDPVGAEIRTCSPEAIAGHACSWAAVGAAKAPPNHLRVRALKTSRDTLSRLLRIEDRTCPRTAPSLEGHRWSSLARGASASVDQEHELAAWMAAF